MPIHQSRWMACAPSKLRRRWSRRRPSGTVTRREEHIMTQAVTVRRDGDTFQARLFWWHAARLLDPVSPIIRVGFETGPKSFDDIWVEYDPMRSATDQYGDPLLR